MLVGLRWARRWCNGCSDGHCVGSMGAVVVQWALCWFHGCCSGAMGSVLVQWALCWCSGLCSGAVVTVLVQWALCWFHGHCSGAMGSVQAQWALAVPRHASSSPSAVGSLCPCRRVGFFVQAAAVGRFPLPACPRPCSARGANQRRLHIQSRWGPICLRCTRQN